MAIDELTKGMDKEEIEFYRECALREGVEFEEWLKSMKEGEF